MKRSGPNWSSIGLAIVLCLYLPVDETAAQAANPGTVASTASTSPNREDLYFYHGSQKGSRFVRMGSAKMYDFEPQQQIRLRLPTGSQVCVTVLNAHPVNYVYSLGVAIDTSRPVIPALTGPLSALGDIFNKLKPRADVEAKDTSVVVEEGLDLVFPLGNAVQTLANEVIVVEDAARSSDAPEALSAVDPEGPDETRGYRAAQEAIARQSDATGSFRSGSAKLTEYFEKLAKDAKEAIERRYSTTVAGAELFYAAKDKAADTIKDTRRRATEKARIAREKEVAIARLTEEAKIKGLLGLITETLLARGKELAAKAGYLSKAFEAEGRVELCGRIGSGPTTLTLKVVAKDGGYGSSRDTKDKIVQEIIARPPYGRETVSVHPVALAALAGSVPQFAVSNGTLIGPPADQIAYRVGAVVNLNVLSFGADDALGFGIALGAGVTSKSEVVGDIFVAGVVSLRDVVRIGLGLGASRFPSSVKGIAVGQPFDPDAGKLEDLIETSMKRAYHIIFVLPGIKL